MLNEITKKEFEERYPEVSTYGLEAYSPVYKEEPRQAAALLGFFILY